MIGNINKIETLGLVDGPGVRIVIFLQKCNLRCIYCHNPETWLNKEQQMFTSKELIDFALKYKNYIMPDGGITFSGGEPLLQPEFLIETLKLAKTNNFHTCLDTSGVGVGQYEEILKYTDLIILDVKATTDEEYKNITSVKKNEINNFIKALQNSNKKVWIRQVIIPTINDTEENIQKLMEYIKPIKNIEKVELIPYHSLGKEKYKELNLEYKLNNIPDMSKEILDKLQKQIKEY